MKHKSNDIHMKAFMCVFFSRKLNRDERERERERKRERERERERERASLAKSKIIMTIHYKIMCPWKFNDAQIK